MQNTNQIIDLGCFVENPAFKVSEKIQILALNWDFRYLKRGSRGIAPCGADGAKPRQNLNSPKGWGLGGLKLDLYSIRGANYNLLYNIELL